MWHCLLKVYTNFRIDISKHIQQGQGSSHATHPLILLIICTKYGKNPSWTVDATGRTRNVNGRDGGHEMLTGRDGTGRDRTGRDRTDGRTDGRMDGQGESNTPPPPNFVAKGIKNVRKTFPWLGALLTPTSKCFCLPDENQLGSRHLLYRGVYQIWGLYINFEAMNAEKWLWLILGCKVGQSVLTGMQLELDVWHHLLNVFTKFQIDTLKHVE